jgi:hypothetical protein
MLGRNVLWKNQDRGMGHLFDDILRFFAVTRRDDKGACTTQDGIINVEKFALHE